jgi:hypothetical protein
MSEIKFSRVWAMPNPRTFEIKPIAELLQRVLLGRQKIVDPFAFDSKFATHTNDLSPAAQSSSHLDAVDYLQSLLDAGEGGTFDAALLDPPYSPRQMSEAYKNAGRKVGMSETQNGRLYKECKDRLSLLLKPGGVAVTCGWNSNGFGINRGFRLEEILLVPCGAAHNDYIVTVEVRGEPC